MTINVQVAAKWRNNIKIRVVNISEVHVDVRQHQAGGSLGIRPLGLSYADSNHDKQNQNLLCYHYTIRQSLKVLQSYHFYTKQPRKSVPF
jgi:hypothetical protein